MTLNDLFQRRLVVVMGKGGVGRTTATAALALAAARQGRRVVLVELSGMAAAPPLFGLDGRSYAPRWAAPGLDLVSLTPEEAVDDFGRRKLRVAALLRVVLRSRATKAFIDAVPGLHDLLQLGKIENMLVEPGPGDPRYDLAILDAPATGHGLTLLAAATSMTELTRTGPFAELAKIISQFLADPARTALVLVTLPEALPVHESVEMIEALRSDGAHLSGLLVNKVRPSLLPDHPPWPEVRDALTDRGADGAVQELVALADRTWSHQRDQTRVLDGLGEAMAEAAGRPVPVVRLPLVEGGSRGQHLVGELADALLEATSARAPARELASGRSG